MSDDDHDEIEELNSKIAEGVREQLGAAPLGGYIGEAAYQPPVPRAKTCSVDVEILESGMVLRYAHPVKRTIKLPHRTGLNLGNDPSIHLFFEGLASIIDGGEDWNEDGRKGKVQKIFEKMKEMSAPRTVEKYVVEKRSIACKNTDDLAQAIETAKASHALIRELSNRGELQQHIHGCFGAPPGSVFGDPEV